MLYRSCCCALLFHFILLKEFHFNDAESSGTNNDTVESIFIQIDNRQFQLYGMKKTWWDAILNCEQNGMILGEVKTMNEARLLSQKMLKNRPVAIESAWIGGYKNLSEKQNSEWRWLSNDEKIEDDNELWLGLSKIDDNSDLESTSPNSHCLLLDWHLLAQTNPRYVKASCDRKREFICQNINETIIENSKRTMSPPAITQSHSEVSTPNHRSVVTPVPMYSTSTTVKQKSKKKRKKKKVKEIMTSPPTTITDTTEEEYLDYKMWEFGKAQMKRWKKKNAKENMRKKMSSTLQKKSDSLKRIRIQESNYNSAVTRKPEVTTSTTRKPLKPLRLYYAFEGPMVGGLTATPMPYEESDREEKHISARRYHKYINRRKYNQYMAKMQNRY